MKWALRIGALLALLGAAGFAAVLAGLVPVRASTGHWDVTEWLLELAKRRSLATRTLWLELPRLDEPWLVTKGAGQYDLACRPCHGSPAHARSRIVKAMLPPPPELAPIVGERDREELFYVIKHGLKFTGMPAWPSQQRDDEVHAMVAFLLELPALDAAGYRRLVASDVASEGPDARCVGCHGREGRGRGDAAYPKLAGQRSEYLVRALAAYDRERRHSGIMSPVAAALTEAERVAVADYYSGIPGTPLGARDAPAGSDPRVERGRAIAHDGIPSQQVPPCRECHGPDVEPRNAAYPHLAGQYADYLVLQLELFQRGHRGGSEYAHLMARTAKRLTAEQMRDVAAYYAAFADR